MYYGFDIGGTKIALGVFDSTRRLQWEKRVPTPHTNYSAFLDAVCELVMGSRSAIWRKRLGRDGYTGMPETEAGTLYAANVPAASGKPLRADLSARLDRDVRLDNDANCFALSEAWDDEFTQYPLVMGLYSRNRRRWGAGTKWEADYRSELHYWRVWPYAFTG
ncbi:ROK family protein [Salmonella bongori]|nr:ROK family protein [Salmonella bongori]